jgi:hypothetical protein
MAESIESTLAARYLASRGLPSNAAGSALRFHPRCYYWRQGRSAGAKPETWPALLAKVTDREGRLTGLHRTWLDPETAWKAPVSPSRKAMGHLLGNGVRIGAALDVLAAGEGLETMLSLRMALPFLPVVAALSASHLAALLLPDCVARLYIAVDADPAGRHAATRLSVRAETFGIAPVFLHPRLGDFNDDLRAFGIDELRAHLRPQLAPVDAARLHANIDR